MYFLASKKVSDLAYLRGEMRVLLMFYDMNFN